MARVSSSGAGGAGGSPVSDSVYRYNEVTNVNPGIETTISTYIAISTAECYLQAISCSGTNVAEYRVYINSTVVDKKYTYFTEFNLNFGYFTGNTTTPGIKLITGDIVSIRAIQNRGSTCNFNALLQILEVEI